MLYKKILERRSDSRPNGTYYALLAARRWPLRDSNHVRMVASVPRLGLCKIAYEIEAVNRQPLILKTRNDL